MTMLRKRKSKLVLSYCSENNIIVSIAENINRLSATSFKRYTVFKVFVNNHTFYVGDVKLMFPLRLNKTLKKDGH